MKDRVGADLGKRREVRPVADNGVYLPGRVLGAEDGGKAAGDLAGATEYEGSGHGFWRFGLVGRFG